MTAPTSSGAPGADTLRLTAEELVHATGGEPLGPVPARVLEGVVTDSRAVPRGSAFFALRGEKHDGADFAASAAHAGAAALVVEARRAREVASQAPGALMVAVDSALRALGLLARWHRRRMPARVVAVTGSNGKTTTKEMLRSILSEAGETHATSGNLNNEVGAPLTLLGLRPRHRFLALELGMNHEGEIARLTVMSEPHAGVVTNAAAVHVEHLGSVENVSRAKGELYAALPLDGTVIANVDDPLMTERARMAGRRTLWFGAGAGADVRLARIISQDASGLRLEVVHEGWSHEVTLPLVGAHNALNACAAFAGALALGLSPDAIVRGLERVHLPGRRLLLKEIPGTGATLLDDCYNANPASTLAALRTLCELAPEGRRIAVLGDMRELGASEAEGHREVGIAAARAGVELLVAFGPASRALAEGAREAGLPAERVLHTEDPGEAAARARSALVPGAVVLVKASRGTRLERVSDLLVPPEVRPGTGVVG